MDNPFPRSKWQALKTEWLTLDFPGPQLRRNCAVEAMMTIRETLASLFKDVARDQVKDLAPIRDNLPVVPAGCRIRAAMNPL